MTAASFAADMIGGGGKYAAVFHIAGQPHAETTSTELAAALSDPAHGGTDAQKKAWAYRALLFGRQWIGGVPQAYPSDHVQIIPSLDPDLGKQSITYDESKGLSGGGWSVKFGREAHGAEYSHFRSGGVANTYDGMDVLPDPIYDSSVKTGILAADWDGSGIGSGTLSWGNDTGLAQLITDNNTAVLPTYVWIRNSCLGIDGDTLAGPVDGVYTVTAYSGCLRTVREKINVITTDGSSYMMASAPMTSVVGMPAILWLVPMTEAGAIAGLPTAGVFTNLAIYTDPIKFRDGPVKPNPTCDPSQWTVSCGFWEDHWNVDVPTENISGELRGYYLSRQAATVTEHIQMGHLEILDYDVGATAYQRTSIWLCAAGASVYFAKKADLAQALDDELQDRTNSDSAGFPKNQEYTVEYKKLTCQSPTLDAPTYVNGPCAWILALGNVSSADPGGPGAMETPRWEVHFDPYNYLYTPLTSPFPPEDLGWQFVPNSSNATWDGRNTKVISKMRYYYQWNWRNDYHCEKGWNIATNKPFGKTDRETYWYPMPYDSDNADYRLRFKSEFKAEAFDVDEPFDMGSKSKFFYLKGTVATVGDNYITVDDNVVAGNPRLKYGTLSDPCYWGQPLYYWPPLHDDPPTATSVDNGGDQFSVNSCREITSTSMSKLFRGLLGDDSASGMVVPRRTALYHVPDAWDDTYDMRNAIDWDRLDELAPPSINTSFAVQIGHSLNLKKMFFNALLGQGIRQTWGYSESLRGFVMSFEQFGIVSPARAIMSGRLFDNTNLKAAKPTGTYGNTWLYHHATIKFHYEGDNPKYTFSILNRTGRAMMASGNKTLKIEDKIIQLADPNDYQDYLENFQSMLLRMNSAQPNVSANGTPAGLPLAVVGGDCLLTSDLVYDLFAGTRGVTRRAALMTKVTTSISFKPNNNANMTLGFNFRLAEGMKGIGPSMRLAAAQITKAGGVVDVTGCTTAATSNEFASTLGGLTDLAHFGCFDWNAATDTVALRGCSCAKYAITIIDADVTTWDIAGAGRNVFRGRIYGASAATLELADLTNGTCTISIDTDYATFSDASDKIVFFCEYDNANLQQCQKDMYGWLGDEDGRITDTSGNTPRAMTWS